MVLKLRPFPCLRPGKSGQNRASGQSGQAKVLPAGDSIPGGFQPIHDAVSRFRWIRHLPSPNEPGALEAGGEQRRDRLAELEAQVASLSEELDWVRVENQRLSETMIIDLSSGL